MILNKYLYIFIHNVFCLACPPIFLSQILSNFPELKVAPLRLVRIHALEGLQRIMQTHYNNIDLFSAIVPNNSQFSVSADQK